MQPDRHQQLIRELFRCGDWLRPSDDRREHLLPNFGHALVVAGAGLCGEPAGEHGHFSCDLTGDASE